ncbi:MAG TPA: hypothetical protein PLV53_09520, partial [Anaerolineaceae bacterium]|nr:hypothetical protein [Anaerolineaceae bacterium]
YPGLIDAFRSRCLNINLPAGLHCTQKCRFAEADLLACRCKCLSCFALHGIKIFRGIPHENDPAAAAPESVPALTAGGLLKATFAFSLAWTAGFLILLVPGGLGVRELALSGLLVSLFGLTPAAGALAAILTRLIYSLAEAGWILYGLAASRLAPLAPAGTRKEGQSHPN